MIGGLANIAEEYATKRATVLTSSTGGCYRCRWRKCQPFEVGGLHLHPGIKAALDNPGTTFKGYVIHEDAPVTEITLPIWKV